MHPIHAALRCASRPAQVVRFVGRPSEEDLEAVMNEGALQYIESLPPGEAMLERELASASPLAVDLICKLLTFNADKASFHPDSKRP